MTNERYQKRCGFKFFGGTLNHLNAKHKLASRVAVKVAAEDGEAEVLLPPLKRRKTEKHV